MEDFYNLSLWIILIIFISYFFPSIIAIFKGKSNTTAIIILNIFLGWTFVGWIVALVWAFTVDTKSQTVVINNNSEQPIKSNNSKNIKTDVSANNLEISPNIIKAKIISHQEKIENLEKLKKLLDANILTQQEFEEQKAQILA